MSALTRYGRLVAFAIVAFAGCYRLHERRSDMVTDSPDAAILGGFTITAGPSSLHTCLCHHGCAPGADGTFQLVAMNHTDRAHTLRVAQVTLNTVDTPDVLFVASLIGHFGVPGVPDASATVAAHSTQHVDLEVYLDLTTTFSGNYRAQVSLLVDGIARTVLFDRINATRSSDCGG